MKFLSHKSLGRIGVGVLALATGMAQAHNGHDTSGVVAGLVHPLGLDHLLVMLAVGIWSVSALPAGKAWWGPAVFMMTLLLSAVLGATGLSVPFLEPLISLTVVLLGVMLMLSRQGTPVAFGLGLVTLVASLHGLAHGAETPGSGFAGYALGFLLSTATLHVAGLVAGRGIKHQLARTTTLVVTGLGTLCGAAGLYLVGSQF
jgi:urease accessory protein